MKKAYLAGPTVFRTDAIQRGKEMKEICRANDIDPIFPMDNEIEFEGKSLEAVSKEIYSSNIDLMNKADFGIIDMNAFRGAEADTGTMFEAGYLAAQGKDIFGYVDKAKPLWKLVEENSGGVTKRDGVYYDKDGMMIEEFGHPINLMLAESAVIIVEGGFEKCVEVVSRYLHIMNKSNLHDFPPLFKKHVAKIVSTDEGYEKFCSKVNLVPKDHGDAERWVRVVAQKTKIIENDKGQLEFDFGI